MYEVVFGVEEQQLLEGFLESGDSIDKVGNCSWRLRILDTVDLSLCLVTLCRVVDGYQRLGERCHLHLQSRI